MAKKATQIHIYLKGDERLSSQIPQLSHGAACYLAFLIASNPKVSHVVVTHPTRDGLKYHAVGLPNGESYVACDPTKES